MKRYKIWCAWLLVWIICCTGSALAESRYNALSAGSNVVREDVAAWIEIPSAGFSKPVMQRAEDDTYYAVHDPGGGESEFGSLYTQASYNAADFSDPVTVVYGSSKTQGTPLRRLQELYSGQFEENRRILLHLPEETVEYEVFAAIPYSSLHILHYYDFSVERRYEGFFEDVFRTRQLGMHLDEESRPEYGDKVLILSTGLRGDSLQRYLVMAKAAK